jgi:hypothetical protein
MGVICYCSVNLGTLYKSEAFRADTDFFWTSAMALSMSTSSYFEYIGGILSFECSSLQNRKVERRLWVAS